MDTQHVLRISGDAPADWWRGWWSRDYSWHGLTGRSLQDDWRGEAAQLIAEPGTGRLWTRFHCPLHFADGSVSPKASWTAEQWRDVRARLRSRLALADSARPCRLDGMVLDGLAESEEALAADDGAALWLSARDACFLGPVDARNLRFGLADFSGAWFGGGADFTGSVAPRVATTLPPAEQTVVAPELPPGRQPAVLLPTTLPKLIVTEPEPAQTHTAKPRRRVAMWLAAGAVALGAAAILLLKTL